MSAPPTAPKPSPGANPDPHARLRVAIFGPDGRVRALMSATPALIAANTPPGGRWTTVPSHVRRTRDVRA